MKTVDSVKNRVNHSCSWRAVLVPRVQLLAQALLRLSLAAASSKHATQDLQRGIVAPWDLAASAFCNRELLSFCPAFFRIWFALILDLAALFHVACRLFLHSALSCENVAL